MGPTEALARFAVEMDGRSMKPSVIHSAKGAILDCLGVALAGPLEQGVRIIVDQISSQGRPLTRDGIPPARWE